MKYTFLLMLILIFSLRSYSQYRVVRLGNNKYYKVYDSFEAANKGPIDSVEGLCLTSNGFKNFPADVLKYKNLKYLEIGSYSWSEVVDSLTKKQRKQFEKIKNKYPLSYTVKNQYKANKVRSIPEGIKELKKLELVDFLTAEILNIKKFKKIYTYLPNTEIIPSREFLEQND